MYYTLHREVNNAFFMLTSKCKGDRWCDVVVADFGLSKVLLGAETLRDAVGTLCYVAPELLEGAQYTQTVDTWALGVILFLMLRGRLPFDGDSADAIARTLFAMQPRKKPPTPSFR